MSGSSFMSLLKLWNISISMNHVIAKDVQC